MPVTGPTVVRRQLGRRLRRLREQASRTEQEVERAKVCSRTTLWRIESGKGPVKMTTVRGLCWFYGADPEVTDALTRLANGTDEHGWWESHGDAVPDWFRLYVGLEAAASDIQIYDPELIHGLLQTPEYARAVFRAAEPAAPVEAIERRVNLRLERQLAYFDRADPARITAVFGAGALLREVGGPEVMAEQRDHLATLGQRVKVSIRVLPFAAGAHAAMVSPFIQLDFADPEDPDIVYVESHLGAHYLERPGELAEYRRIFDLIQRQSTPIEQYESEEYR
ncbi:helix-turn-helix transcriptional regulator [Solwaraspora sp. WMMD1047]|uniref:helix-turn-helix domain-containing protein n=1 Tax=Solwaraspora sp. WMMD1047 TaxID=3016102 RepID=UPI002417243E|nr:helix-turn-helix transcriptional regulator [Solwaraspora sp. WMMD1047]MDG4832766.1 helix-turn-helix transcriptional regulator [Solwaraspora sp. WMMD1047]